MDVNKDETDRQIVPLKRKSGLSAAISPSPATF